jgi:hypothetical protein
MGLHATTNPQRACFLSDGARPHAAEVSVFSSVQLPDGSRLCMATPRTSVGHLLKYDGGRPPLREEDGTIDAFVEGLKDTQHSYRMQKTVFGPMTSRVSVTMF